jgi:hypothetical protein
VASHPPAQPAQPAGAEHSYEVLSDQVVRQVAAVDGLDTKLGVAVVALITVAGAIYAANPPRIVAALVSGWLLVALIQAIRGFRYTTFIDGVNAKFLDERMHLLPAEIKRSAWVVLKAADEVNQAQLDRKGRRLMQVTYTLGLVAGLGLLGKALGIS